MSSDRRSSTVARPLTTATLDQLALRYVGRFATTQGRLEAYLRRKLRERGWDDGVAADPAATAARMVALGYVDDAAFAGAKAGALARRGYGARRVAQALHAAHVDAETAATAIGERADDALGSALQLARRRRFGPFAATFADDPRVRERQVAVMVRAGHGVALARRVVAARDLDDLAP